MSAAYQAAALELNGRGRLVTLDWNPARSEVARRNLEELGLAPRVEAEVGAFQELLDPVLDREGPVDFAFVDGNHKEDTTVEYFERISASASETALLAFDDIRWSRGMRRAWRAIAADPKVGLSIDIGWMALCLVGERRDAPR